MKTHPESRRGQRPRLRAALTLVAATAAATGVVACGGSSKKSTTNATAKIAAGYPVTVMNCGTKIAFDGPPTRAVANDLNTTEDMIALGLTQRMVGQFAAKDSLPAGASWPSQYAAGFNQIKEISPAPLTFEPLIGLHPDFLFAGWNYGLHVGSTLTPANLAHYGIKTLALTESCAHVQASKQSVTIANTYQDLTNLGRIFDVTPKAHQVIDSMKQQIATVQSKVANLKKVTVFDYDSGTSAPFTGPGLAMPTAEISLAGGKNIFSSLKQTWTTVSWEQVVKANPQCIVINDYSTPSAAAKEKFLETSPITKNLTAVKNHCFLPLTYDEVTPGPRDGEAVIALAHWLHPKAFGLSADGS